MLDTECNTKYVDRRREISKIVIKVFSFIAAPHFVLISDIRVSNRFQSAVKTSPLRMSKFR
jgi:hypothetical protein